MKFITIAISVLFIFSTSFFVEAAELKDFFKDFHFYHEGRTVWDEGLTFELSQNEGYKSKVYNKSTNRYETIEVKKTKTIYDMDDPGFGLGFDYVVGTGTIDWKGKQLFGFGLLSDIKFNSASETNLFSFHVGPNLRFLWIFEINPFSVGYTYFTSDLPTVVRYEIDDANSSPKAVLKNKNLSGFSYYSSFGMIIPLTRKTDFVLQYQLCFYDDQNNNESDEWYKDGLLIGIEYKF